MARSSQLRRHWHDYHPEAQKLSGIKGRPVKVHDIGHVRRTMQEMAAPQVEGPFAFESPESSTIAAASYERASDKLTIHFKRKGRLDRYDYDQVPISIWVEFAQAPSKGSFFAARIRPIYKGHLIPRE